jgi:hypothetical protein
MSDKIYYVNYAAAAWLVSDGMASRGFAYPSEVSPFGAVAEM